ncbi:hypothetical protein ABZ858_23960 [Streptomyces sp. NPDC047017]|uniref:hypothetical protein n=1 Tax=Streptomyces sp. NPDC047017 TaxID=3155024 RepID=UPI003411C97F
MKRKPGRALALLAGGLLAVAATVVGTGGEAQAATPFASLPASTLSQFSLDPGTSFSDFGTSIAAVEAAGDVTVENADQVLVSGGTRGSTGLCHSTGLASSLSPTGFCWAKPDDTSDSYTAAGGWTPQGITGSYDAQPNGSWGDGTTAHTAYLASWHFDQDMGTADAKENEFARVTLVNADKGAITYNHLLLVQPTGDASAGGNFTAAPNTHADGVVWYGNKVFVASGRWLQVYDLQHIWKVSSTQQSVGISGGASSARGYDYALPMTGRYRTTSSDNTACASTAGTGPCLNSLSLDRSGQDGLVSAEFSDKNAGGGRVLRWPLNYRTALPATTDPSGIGLTHPTLGYVSPVWHMQGAATDGANWYIAGDCPGGVGGGSGDALPYSCIHKTQPDQAPHVLSTSPVLTEDLGYSPSAKRLWGINERINSTVGERVVFSVTTG